jgi:hypothetical protein
MAIRDPWAAGTLSYDAEEARVAQAAKWTPATNAYKALTGLKPGPSNPAAVTATGTPDGFVHVAPFVAIIQSSRAANAGVYTLTVDATVDINILATPAHATNPRNDLIIAHTPDTFYGDPNSTPVVRSVVGTPSGSPADPSLAAYPDAITLARVRVDALAATIVTGKITDLRPAQTVAVGGILPVASSTLRNALTGLYTGWTIYRTDRKWTETYDGTAWRVNGVPHVSSVADLSAITNPYTGQTAYNTGDALLHRYTGSAWTTGGKLLTYSNEAHASSLLGTTTVATDIPGATLTFTTTVPNATAIVDAAFDFSKTAHALAASGALLVDGVMQTAGCQFSDAANVISERMTLGQTWRVVLASAGSHTCKLQAWKSAAVGVLNANNPNTKIRVQVFE